MLVVFLFFKAPTFKMRFRFKEKIGSGAGAKDGS